MSDTELETSDEAEEFATAGTTALAEDPIDDIPEELRFDTGGDVERESVPIMLGGMRTVLLQPSESAMLLSGNAWSEQVGDIERSNAIMTLINVCLDEAGRRHLRQQMLDPTVDFNDGVLAELLDVILTRWGSDVVPAKNREQRRAAARAAKKAKSGKKK